MAFRLAFRFERNDYSESARANIDREIKVTVQQKLDQKGIKASRIYEPGRNSIKVIFLSEVELNKVLDNEEHFTRANLYPKLSITLKASRTVFCGGFDPALLENSSKEDIQTILETNNWKIKGVYILRSGKSFKVEFRTKEQAYKFINTQTNIEGVMLKPEHKEIEVDPIINQCWVCGRINPNHGSGECSNTQRCLRCGERGHKFFNCNIPRKIEDMTERQRAKRYCIPCGTQGNHTSMDHTACPTKREIIRGRTAEARSKRGEEIQNDKRDVELITRVFNYTNKDAWPQLQHNPDQTKVSTIVTLALLDEAVNPGIFQSKLSRSCEQNNIPKVKYTLEPNTATAFYNTLCGAATQIPVVNQHMQQSKTARATQPNILRSEPGKVTPHIISINTGKTSKALHPNTSNWGKRNLTFNDIDSIDLAGGEGEETGEKRPRKQSPLVPMKTTSNTGGQRRDSIDTIWRLTKLRDTLDDNSLVMEGLLGGSLNGAKNLGSIVDKKITIKALLEMLNVVKLHNDRMWVQSLREKLEYLISKGLGEHLVPYKAKTTTAKNNGETSQQHNFLH